MSNRDDEDLAELLAELERTLTDLRTAVDDDVRRRRRPPTPSEILRFTEAYTLPTMIALLEATVQSLELLRAVLRLTDPEATTDRLRTQLTGRERGPTDAALRETVTNLRNALTGADLPEDTAAASIVADARELTAAIENRLDEPAANHDERRNAGNPDRGVAIDVEDEADQVDVEEELDSIRESVKDEQRDE